MNAITRRLSLLIAVFAILLPLDATLLLAAEDSPVMYNRDIRPLLSDKCFHCHGPDEADRQAGLRLDQAAGAEGAYRESGGLFAIKPGSLEDSELWNRITTDDVDLVMPPPSSHKKPLTAAERELMRRWIEQGATYEAFWAFIPPTAHDLLSTTTTSGSPTSDSPIDAIVKKRLIEEGLKPADEADRRTLIRRLTFDLTGLPPTRQEIENFLNDQAPDAYESLVDRLLESPHYGEHMAKYWLDLVRFADTNGIHHDHYRDLTPYRDWVIRSFNSNLPYDQFVRYQIAGDLFENPQQDQLVASGFNRLHLIIDRGTMLPEESFTRNVIDRVSAVGTAFMGLTLQCAVCHDHKYDPITQKDFFSLAGFFNNIDAEPETGGRSGTDFVRGLQEPYINLTTPEQERQLAELANEIKNHQARSSELKTKLTKLEADVKQQQAALDEAVKLSETKKAAESDRDPSTDQDTKGDQQTSDPEQSQEEQQPSEIETATEKLESLKAELAKLKAETARSEKELKQAQKAHDDYLLTIPAAMIMKERTEVRPSHILVRGAYDNLGEQVERATPGFLPPMKTENEVKSRMDLADWLVDPQNPLTARVAVNRFWQQLFGVGIVRTSEDFGAQGEWPSHPELLDYLSVRFVDSHWDIKNLMKEMVMSHTYRQSSIAAPDVYQRDPQNRLLARGSRYRMDSEMIRDQILATSGLLNAELFGKSVKPPQPDGLWQAICLPSSYPNEYKADAGNKIYRRSLYTFWKRAMPPPQMSIFNAPSREECIARRERTNTPLQALLMMNEVEYLKAARLLAAETLASEQDDQQRVLVIYETITSQLPGEAAQKSLLALARDLESMYGQAPDLAVQLCADNQLPDNTTKEQLAAWTMVASAIYNLDIVKTKQ